MYEKNFSVSPSPSLTHPAPVSIPFPTSWFPSAATAVLASSTHSCGAFRSGTAFSLPLPLPLSLAS